MDVIFVAIHFSELFQVWLSILKIWLFFLSLSYWVTRILWFIWSILSYFRDVVIITIRWSHNLCAFCNTLYEIVECLFMHGHVNNQQMIWN